MKMQMNGKTNGHIIIIETCPECNGSQVTHLTDYDGNRWTVDCPVCNHLGIVVVNVEHES